MAYLDAFADQFQLHKYVQYNSLVARMDPIWDSAKTTSPSTKPAAAVVGAGLGAVEEAAASETAEGKVHAVQSKEQQQQQQEEEEANGIAAAGSGSTSSSSSRGAPGPRWLLTVEQEVTAAAAGGGGAADATGDAANTMTTTTQVGLGLWHFLLWHVS